MHEPLAALLPPGAFPPLLPQALRHLSHAIRTPITCIVGHAELIGDEAQATGNVALGQDAAVIREAGRELLVVMDLLLGALAPPGALLGSKP